MVDNQNTLAEKGVDEMNLHGARKKVGPANVSMISNGAHYGPINQERVCGPEEFQVVPKEGDVKVNAGSLDMASREHYLLHVSPIGVQSALPPASS